MPGDPKSVLTADAPLGNDHARFLCVVSRSPRTLSLCPAWGSRTGRGFYPRYTRSRSDRTRQEHDQAAHHRYRRRESQAYGRREETAAIFSCRCRCCRRLRVGKTRGSSRNCISGWPCTVGSFPHPWLPRPTEFWRSTNGGRHDSCNAQGSSGTCHAALRGRT